MINMLMLDLYAPYADVDVDVFDFVWSCADLERIIAWNKWGWVKNPGVNPKIAQIYWCE